MRERDVQQSKLYTAERSGAELSALFHAHDFDGIEDIQRFVNRVLARAVIRRRWPWAHISVKPHKGGRTMSFAYGSNGGGTIYMLASHRSKLLVLHEVAHCLAPRGTVHGPAYAKVYIWLVSRVLGKGVGDMLRASFRRHRVRYRVVTEAQRANGRRLAASYGFQKVSGPVSHVTKLQD